MTFPFSRQYSIVFKQIKDTKDIENRKEIYFKIDFTMHHNIGVLALHQKLIHWAETSERSVDYNGLNFEQWFLTHYESITKILQHKNILLTVIDEECATRIQSFLKQFFNTALYPDLDASIYDSTIHSESTLYYRFKVLQEITHSKESLIIIATLTGLALKTAPKYLFNNTLTVSSSDIYEHDELSKKLINLGYQNTPTVEEPGTFSRKGEIFDIYPISKNPVRLHFFDEMIEEIFEIDPDTQRTKLDSKIESIELGVSPLIFLKHEYQTNLRSNIPQAQPNEIEKFEARKEIFNKLGNNQLFDNYALFTPLFFKETSTLLDFINLDECFVINYNQRQSLENLYEFIEHNTESYYDIESDSLLPSLEYFIDLTTEKKLNSKSININHLNIDINLENNINESIDLNIIDAKVYLNKIFEATHKPSNHVEYVKAALLLLKEKFKTEGKIHFFVRNENSKKEIQFLLEQNEYDTTLLERIHFYIANIESGFYFKNEHIFYLAESDLFTYKRTKTKSVKNKDLDLFAEQLSTLKAGDFVIHKQYGIGKYLGLEPIRVGEIESDFVIIEYADDDKVYLPVYKLDSIQKYSESTGSTKVASLKSKKFQNLKDRAKNSVKKLAFDLLELQAKRETSVGFQFSEPGEMFRDFEKNFPYQETPDQIETINSVINDMCSSKPMDRLVCGDVGFGKTEIAMRAAYKAVLDHKQVAVLVPTTVLSLQHSHSFRERFKDTAVEIDFLSRFKSTKEANETISKLEEGKIDIIIGTHKLLSDKIKFHDLGLVIVDEEHRFGVGHKEKLKLLKENTDFLTMTATPIPRTLQISFLGIRDLSLIKTPPPKRKSIKSYIIKEDENTLRQAIKKELQRGGQIFIVHNRVNDIELFSEKISKLVPEAKIVIAHGQMSERQLESKIQSFFNGQYDILISTTIIESGIDIPNANTMIIDRADNFGLAQLHQLRGRIGRSDKKAYAYFVIPKTRNLSPIASKRLQALKKYADIGSGFSIASSDLEIRGAGDILGAEQSGHIENIGLELYMELLKETIAELKGQKQSNHSKIEVHSRFPAFIPNKFITDPSQRLKFYKKLSNASDINIIENIISELSDIYGVIPKEIENLKKILYVRVILAETGLKIIKLGKKKIELFFDKEVINTNNTLQTKLLDYFLSHKKKFKVNPDFSVTYISTEETTLDSLIDFSYQLKKQIFD